MTNDTTQIKDTKMGVKEASAAQLEHQIVYNDAELRGKLEFIALAPNHPLSAQYRARCQILRMMIEKCRAEYRLKTGKEYPYVMPIMPLVVKGDSNLAQQQKTAEQKKMERRRIQDLIDLGLSDVNLLESRMASDYALAHDSDFANLIFSHWARIFGAANPLALKSSLELGIPKIKKHLRSAQAALNKDDFKTAHHELAAAASEMKRVHSVYSDFLNRVRSGAAQAEMAIKFYAAVAMGGVGGAGGTLTAAQQAALAVSGEAASQITSLIMKGQKESLTAKELAAAMFSIGMAGATAYGSQLLSKTLKAVAPQLAQRIASKAVDKYLGDLSKVDPGLRAKVLAKVTEYVHGRIIALGMSAVQKAVAQITDYPSEPNWNFWESIFEPMIGGSLGAVVKEAARNAEANQPQVPAGT